MCAVLSSLVSYRGAMFFVVSRMYVVPCVFLFVRATHTPDTHRATVIHTSLAPRGGTGSGQTGDGERELSERHHRTPICDYRPILATAVVLLRGDELEMRLKKCLTTLYLVLDIRGKL